MHWYMDQHPMQILNNPKSFLIDSVPGTVIVVPTLNINNTNNVNRIFFLKSLFLGVNICLTVANIIKSPLLFRLLLLYFLWQL